MTRALSDEFPCRDCGKTVRWTESKSGSKYLAQPKIWHGDETATVITYWPSHRCTPNPEWQARVAVERQAAEERKAAKAAAVEAGIVAPEGRVRDITAAITKITNKGDERFPEWKMTVQTDEGWSAWMSIPKALVEFAGYPARQIPTVEVGDRITFTATVTRSERDPLFGFAKRPVVTVDPAHAEEKAEAKRQAVIERVTAQVRDTYTTYIDTTEELAAQRGVTVEEYIADQVARALADRGLTSVA